MKPTIAQKNDLLWATFIGCKVILTDNVAASKHREEILSGVRNFNAFATDNNPYGENDFAFIEVAGERCFFKFDYYDESYEFYQEDGLRVLTIGYASEY